MPLFSYKWTSLVVLLLLIIPCHRTIVTALSCYQCNSFADKDCLEGNLGKYKTVCQGRAVGCRKLDYMIDFHGTGVIVRRVARQCSKTQTTSGCIKRYRTNGKRYKQFICECSGDYCNESTRSRSQTPFVYIISMVTMIVVSLI